MVGHVNIALMVAWMIRVISFQLSINTESYARIVLLKDRFII